MALKLNIKPTGKNTSQTFGPDEARQAATSYRDLTARIEELDTEAKILRAQLLEVVSVHRRAALEKGLADNSVAVPTIDGNKVTVIYQERYKPIGDDNIPVLQEAFGSDYSLFVEEQQSIELNKGVNLTTLRAACGKQADAVLALFTVTNEVAPRKGAFGHIANLYKNGQSEVAENLLSFVDACISSPQVRCK
jgi:hypothetical protein